MALLFNRCKRYLVVIIFLSISIFLVSCNPEEKLDSIDNLNVMSYNMRFEKQINPEDPIHTWEVRKPGIIKSFSDYDAHIVGTQELEGWQNEELAEGLGEKWSNVGLPRFLKNDENSNIYWRDDLIENIMWETIWLSETPEKVGSKGWGAKHPRILTYGKFKIRETGFEFYFFNTHLDHYTKEARLEGLNLIVEYMLKFKEYPVILTGDLNMYPEAAEMHALNSRKELYMDTFSPLSPKFDVNGKTTHGFNGGIEGKPIDYIYYSIRDFELIDTIIIHDKVEDRYWLSDHYPVYSQLKLK